MSQTGVIPIVDDDVNLKNLQFRFLFYLLFLSITSERFHRLTLRVESPVCVERDEREASGLQLTEPGSVMTSDLLRPTLPLLRRKE